MIDGEGKWFASVVMADESVELVREMLVELEDDATGKMTELTGEMEDEVTEELASTKLLEDALLLLLLEEKKAKEVLVEVEEDVLGGRAENSLGAATLEEGLMTRMEEALLVLVEVVVAMVGTNVEE